jgi:hypothetical protein
MKKIILFLFISIILINSILAVSLSDEIISKKDSSKNNSSINNSSNSSNKEKSINETEENNNRIRNNVRRIIQEKNITCPENCTCVGSVIKCDLKNGTREMTIIAGKSGNVIVQVKNINMSTNVTLYHHNGKVYRDIGNNQTKEIKYLPDKVKEKIEERLRQKNCTCENMTLDENGIYKVRIEKKARLFLLFSVKEKVNAEIDSETGEIIRIKNPWGGFLARDNKE